MLHYMATSGQIRIGISGWQYKGWRGVFYPPKLPHRRELEFAAGKFSTLEINGTFYSLQRPSSFERWASETPADFVFAVKGPRYITHMLKLRNARIPLANFFASGVLLLGAKFGPLLWQFPPIFRFDARKIKDFFERIPRDFGAAKRLARKHDKWLRKRVSFEDADSRHKLRHAIEIRHPSLCRPRIHRVAAQTRCCNRVRRYCRVAAHFRCHFRLCLLSATRLAGVVCQRLRCEIAGHVG
jgi:uncharacterized protein YecE (DUF72 family)